VWFRLSIGKDRRMAPSELAGVAAEIEAHVAETGWDRGPTLFALVTAGQFAQDEPETADRLGLSAAEAAPSEVLIPIEQEALPDGDLDEVLAQIAWPATVTGCALSQEILILPPSAQDAVASAERTGSVEVAASHPERREARLVVAVLRDGSTAAMLRLRGTDGGADDVLTGAELAPNLAAALLSTLRD
jgi:hypothetical protein